MHIMANKPNGTLHVGITSNIFRRVYEHRNNLYISWIASLVLATTNEALFFAIV